MANQKSLSTTAASGIRQRIERVLKAFSDPAQPELTNFISGVAYDEGSTIDDGEYGDPTRDSRPDFLKRDTEGWEPL